MGMTAKYVTVSASELEQVLAGGAKTIDIIWHKGTAAESCCWDMGKFAEDKQLAEAKQLGLHLWVDIDKDYRELHSLLTGTGFPKDANDHNLLSLALYAKDTVAGTAADFGYGPVRYLTPARVEEIAAVLAETRCSDLAEKNSFHVEEGDYMEAEFNAFKKFFVLASEAHDA